MQPSIGLLGGSFNPIHYGHLAMAEAAVRALSLSAMIIMPAGDPPHKSVGLADKYDRLQMARLAAGDLYAVSALEVERPGKTYTVDTLDALAKLYPGFSAAVLIGADTLTEISGWQDSARVFTLCRFVVFGRNGLPLPDVPGADIIRLPDIIPDISASQIRARVRRGQSLDGYVPPSVADYIGEKRLYDPPARMPYPEMRAHLSGVLPSKRYLHTLGVENTMRKLANHWQYNAERAALTGLLHDCAKGLSFDELRKTAAEAGLHIDSRRMESCELLHAPVGAQLARAVYGVTDPEILRSVWYHSTGACPMNDLDKLLCVADMTEPGRRANDQINRLRKLSMRDLDEAARETLALKLAHVAQQGKAAHPDTERAIGSLGGNNEKGGVLGDWGGK
ncbi:MAG: nicotinate (nicotinamide) nucleotide adenylyltransferase [Clostridia bacterium]|nr:nicotinate (nicotinamide) nucleotide adenylyltransferase [Clostridia bacterium]